MYPVRASKGAPALLLGSPPYDDVAKTLHISLPTAADEKLSDLPAAQLRRAVRFRRQTATTNVGESYPRDPDHRASDSCGDDESRRSDTPMRACKSGRKLRMAILIEAPMH